MALYSFSAISFSNLSWTGPNPFASDATRNAATYNTTVLTIGPGAQWDDLRVDDGEAFLQDGDSDQDLAQATTFNGTNWPAGTEVEIEYSYYLRPVGSTNPAEWFTIYVLEFEGNVQGIAADTRVPPGDYQILNGGSDDPLIAYADLVVCFTPGTRIACPGGARAVETLREGDLVQTLDNGPQRLVWVGRQVSRGRGRRAPVRIAAGRLGNARDLYLSPQHRVLIRPDQGLPGPDEVLVPVKALLGQAGIRVVPHHQIIYHHLLFDTHQVVLAEGLGAESFFPGPEAIRSLSQADRARLFLHFPELRQGQSWQAARPLLGPGAFRRLWRGHGGGALRA